MFIYNPYVIVHICFNLFWVTETKLTILSTSIEYKSLAGVNDPDQAH